MIRSLLILEKKKSTQRLLRYKMPIYRKCTQCGKKVLQGTLCICEQRKKLESYRDYKRRRMKDKEEKERQEFYVSKPWLKLSEHIKKHYFGLCVICWSKELIQGSEFTHHIETLKDKYELRLDENNLAPLCDCCHKRVHSLMKKSDKDKLIIQKVLRDLIQKFNEKYY